MIWEVSDLGILTGVDNASVRQVTREILVLDRLHQTQLRDRPVHRIGWSWTASPSRVSPVPHGAHHSYECVATEVGPALPRPLEVAHHVHVLVRNALRPALRLLPQPATASAESEHHHRHHLPDVEWLARPSLLHRPDWAHRHLGRGGRAGAAARRRGRDLLLGDVRLQFRLVSRVGKLVNRGSHHINLQIKN